jgi:PAS domain S-box-containing protein
MKKTAAVSESMYETSGEVSQAFREQERLRAIFEMEPVAVYSCDASGAIDHCNRRAVELWGRAPRPGDTDERFCGSHRLYLPDGSYMPHAESPMAQVVKGQLSEVRDGEVVIERADGSRVTVIVNIRPLRDEHGEPAGAINCFCDITERKRMEEALRESQSDLEHTIAERTSALRQLSARLLRAQDDERRRISRELHDSIGQYLAHAKMRIHPLLRANGANVDEKQREAISDAVQALEQCLEETRTLSHLLYPPLLDEVGLGSAARWYVRGFAERSGVEVRLDMPSDWTRLPGTLEILLFRVLQEALTNIHRHAQSRSVDIRLKLAADRVVLEVRDYGRGFPAEMLEQLRAGTGGGVGIRSMRERINELEGQFEIASDASGAMVRVMVPLAAKTENQAGA